MRTLCITQVDHIPGILDRLEALGPVSYQPGIESERVRDEAVRLGSTVIFTNPNMQGFVLGRDHLEGTSVRTICTASTGLNHIDRGYCQNANISVISITSEIDTIKRITSTAELSFALLLSAVRHLPDAQQSVRDGQWTWQPHLGRQVKDLTVGIVGLGRLGEMMAGYCHAFGSRVMYLDPYVHSEKYDRVYSLENLFQICDAVILHVHVKDDTRKMINSHVLSCGRGVVLINTSRGEIVNENDIVASLGTGELSHYGTDVLADEFGDIKKSPLLPLPSRLVTITPHIGGATIGAQSIAYHRAVDLLEETK